MARTRRSRQAADAPAATVPASSDTEQPTRGRTRTSRRAAPSKRQETVDAASAPGPSRAAPASSIRNTSVDSVEVGRRALETPSMRRDTTGLDLADDSIFGDLGDSFADGEIPDAPRSASTTRSWSTFKPRSRQSSVVGRNDPPIRPSSRGGAGNTSALTSSFNIGAFRRRAREPSILGTTRRRGPRSETSGRGAQSELESEGEEEDFAPDAESTPLHARRRTRASLTSTSAVAPQRRDVSAANVSTTRTTRKRKSEAESEERAAKSTRMEAETDSDSEISELTSSPPMPPSTPIRQRATTPINLDEIHAPPASSGSEDEGDVWPDIRALAKRRRRPSVTTPLRAAANDDDDEILSDISSPPSLTHSPNFEARGRGRAALREHHHHHQPKALTTADLANLLPKRKHKRTRHEGDDGSDEEAPEEEEHEQEDEVHETRTRGGRIIRPPSRAASASGGPKQQAGAPAHRTRSASKHKTYGRRSSDKENHSDEDEDEEEEEGDSQFQPLADDTFGETTTAGPPDFQSIDELKRATRKFSEVDQWQLEYEEVAESGSPKGAR
ncbi:hypothetical protein BM221_004559 [Beauveria bassiana]|uniref:Uncharacterized protein n=1 Tax=Beauveria bassiana TaxID=176275 RepID=A0A2N6NRL0_BEABA|nr:hypothetical protein BM221_004559 [Beauveria bassiana]